MMMCTIGISLLLIIACLVSYQKIATLIDDYHFPPQGTLVDVGGYRLHILSTGTDGLTVVLDAGLSGTSLGWILVQEEVSKFTRVCSYDRAGYAWSEAAPSKRTSQHLAEELHRLLHAASIPGPYILVGHSFGGCNVLMFADMYPAETLGVILVDSVHEKMLDVLPLLPQSFFDRFTNHIYFQWLLSVIGYKRLKGPSSEIRRMFEPLPIMTRDRYFAQLNKTSYTQAVSREMQALPESLCQLHKKQVRLQNKPLIVITAGQFTNDHEKIIWHDLQKSLLAKSNRAKHMIAERSDHMINHHQPQIIVDAIREIWEEEKP
jgi:pimeloyl-ACP methyl ester carboxylesterase